MSVLTFPYHILHPTVAVFRNLIRCFPVYWYTGCFMSICSDNNLSQISTAPPQVRIVIYNARYSAGNKPVQTIYSRCFQFLFFRNRDRKTEMATTMNTIPIPHSESPVAACEKSMRRNPTFQSYCSVIFFFMRIKRRGVNTVVAIALPSVLGPRSLNVAE